MGRILITSFEPFGLSGLLRGANASHDVATALKANLPAGDYDFLQLPVSDEAHEIFHNHLDARKPDGILCMGEYMGLAAGTVNLEPYAHDHPVSHNPLTRTDGIKRLSSAFAQSVAPQNRSSIGLYYCNAIYRQALLWAAAQGKALPTAFIHVAVLGERDGQVRAVSDVLDKLGQQCLSSGNKPAKPSSAI